MLEQKIEDLTQKVETLTNNIRQLMLGMQASVKLLAGGDIGLGGEKMPVTDGENEKTDGDGPTSLSDLPEGEIEWDKVDIMDCPYHSGMMSGAYGKNKTGATKDCWSKIKNTKYKPEQYLIDRRLLIELRADRIDSGEEEKTTDSTTAESTSSKSPPQVGKSAPPQMKPQTELLDVDEEGISFTEVCERHVAKHGTEELQKRLMQCAIETDHDYSTMETDEKMTEVFPWVRDELIKHDAAASA